jgi:hypothetical protein
MATTTKTRPLATRIAAAFRAEYGVDAEQFPADPTITPARGADGRKLYRFSRYVAGRDRLLSDGRPVKQSGDIIALVLAAEPEPIRAIWWREPGGAGDWLPVPSIAAMTEWTLDSVCPTPDGRTVEPDDPESWLSLLGLV